MIRHPKGGTEMINSLRLNTMTGFTKLVCCYAPTLQATPEVKDLFYERLNYVIKDIPNTDDKYLIGDFNARVGT